MNLVVPQVGALALLEELIAAMYTGAGVVTVHLYQNNVIPGPGDTLATYTEATFDGYAAVNVTTLGLPFTNVNGQAEQDWNGSNFAMTGSTTPNTIYGYYVTLTPGGGSPALLWAERFSAPISMSGPTNTINVYPQLTAISEF